ncbi:leucine-rich repeat protein [Tanacetum coccineum]
MGFNQDSFLRFGLSWFMFLMIGVVVPVVVLMLTTNCLRCDLYQVKGFELVVVSSHVCLAAVALLCLSHNLRKYGVRMFLFGDQYHGHVQRFSKDYVLKIDVPSIAQVVGVILCLNASAKISHRAQGIATLASRWHALASCGPHARSYLRFSHSKRKLGGCKCLCDQFSSEKDMEEAMNYVPLPTNAQLTSYYLRTTGDNHFAKQAFYKAISELDSRSEESYKDSTLSLHLLSLLKDTAHRAFQFCKQYKRTTEFRSLCEIIRNHLANLNKFVTEAFRSVEDIYGLTSMVKKMPKSSLMAVYYAKLTEIFWISSSHLYHAYAWFKLFLIQKSFNKNLNQKDLQLMKSLGQDDKEFVEAIHFTSCMSPTLTCKTKDKKPMLVLMILSKFPNMNSLQAMIFSSSSSLISFLFYGLAITCLTSASDPASYGGNETDYHALLSFKSMITHDPYKVLATWNHSFHFCEWSGVWCGRRHKRVTAVELPSKGLEGSLSPHVGNLSFLRYLSLWNNTFQGTIPHELGHLSRLRHLYLSINKFGGVIPTNLSRCSNLEDFWVDRNELTGSIPKEMSLLSKLASLEIEYNMLTCGIPPFLGNITSMEVFFASGNPFGGSIPNTLGLWKSLTTFYCYDCNLYGSIPRSIFNLSLLVNLSIAVNHLTGSLPSEIGNQLPNLEWLQLWGNELSGVLPPSLSNCSKLVILEMRDNNFSGKLTIDFSELREIKSILLQNNNLHGRGKADDMKFIDSLRNCTKLGLLVLYNCNLVGMLPISIGNLSHQLSSLWLGYNQFIGSLPSSIGSLVGLTTLDLRANRFTGKIPTTTGNLQKLQVLYLHSNHFSGPIPDAIGNLSLLITLYLYSNMLEGHIPSSLGNCKKLNELDLADNRLSGKIPKQLLLLPSLTNFLILQGNILSGSIPSEIKNLKMLSYLDLSYNNLSGIIPSSLGECISLTMLYLRGNILHGIIPFSLSSLRGLEVLDISQNNLSGKIPQFFDKRFSLEFLNLSFNDFEGKVPVGGVFANASLFSVLGNKRLCGGLAILELPKCKETGSKKKRFPFYVLLILIAPTLLVGLYCVRLFCKKKHNSQPSQSSRNERFLKVSYNELLKATHGFSTANLIGEGGFSSVYKGILDSDDDSFVAVKVLHLLNRGALKSFLAECEAWRNIRHRNLLKIVTSCSSVDFQGNDFKAIVYEFMPNGSVHDWLHSSANTSKLNLLQRINILRDVATALDYLHNCCQTTIVHGDLKPSNILLDDYMVAHVGDFGLARLLGTDLNQNNSSRFKGTIGYAPPGKYGMGSQMASSGDVYSFGILLLELMTGKKPTDDMFNEGLSIHKFASKALPDHVVDVIDVDAIVLQSKEVNAKKVEECLAATIKIGVSCSVDSPPQRMKIEIVVNELQRLIPSKLGEVESNCNMEQCMS